MLQRLRKWSAGWFVAALYAWAVAASGLAHQPIPISVTASILQSIDAAAYALPDGTIPTLCAHDDGAPASPAHVAQRCDACALSAAPGLAPAAQVSFCVPVARTIAFLDRDDDQFSPAARHAPTSRGPPA
jgi:hypothetical protein